MSNFLNEFKQFAIRGNVVDLAVGLAVGAAFQKIISSLVNDIMFPALAPLLNVGNFSDWQVRGIMVGSFIKNIVDFLIIAFFIFLVVKFINRFKKKEEEEKEAEENRQEKLLTEIRDILKNK
jgi:large conductance mechanosensitive channel